MKVFVSTSSKVEDEKLASRVAQVLMDEDVSLVTGGVASGLMKQVFLEFKNKGAHTIVVTLDVYKEDLSEADEVYLMSDTFDRTKKIYDLMDIALFLPGGTGSLSELFAMLEETRTKEAKPLIIYNENGHFDKALNILNDFIKLGFNDQSILDKIIVVNNLEELKNNFKNIKVKQKEKKL